MLDDVDHDDNDVRNDNGSDEEENDADIRNNDNGSNYFSFQTGMEVTILKMDETLSGC